LDFLVKAFAMLNDENAVLVLVGEDMGFRKTLEKLVSDLGIKDKVIFTGGLYGQEKLEALVDADVAAFPSRAEQGLPFAALEAIMCGTPIIVTDGTGAAEDVKKMGAGLVAGMIALTDADLIQDLNIGIQHVLDYKESHLVKNGQSYIRKNLSITEKVKDYEELYRRCLK
jgi:glycosyltransferase involved in cell wall biosynthesis